MSALITPELKGHFERIVSYYPDGQKQAAVIPLLHLIQDTHKQAYLPVESQQAVADYLAIPISKVHEVVSFYTMLSEKPRGKNHMLVCHTLPCDLTGCATVIETIQEKLHLKEGEVSADGKFSYDEVECLARCSEGAVMQVGDQVYTELTREKTLKVLDELAKRS